MSRASILAAALLAALGLTAGACQQPLSLPTADVQVAAAANLPLDPLDAAWGQAPEHVARLVLQDLVEPRLMKASTTELRVRALSDGKSIAFRLEWADATVDAQDAPAMFSDACAVQLPASALTDVPAPQMGEMGRSVEITYWRASWQAVVDGRPDSISELYPNAAIDHYPFEATSLQAGSEAQQQMAARYAPARSLGNTMAGPRTSPVEDLLAEGPGTLTRAGNRGSTGRGRHTGSGWAVVVARPLPAAWAGQTSVQAAFAVWEGAQQEAGAKKMRTGWIPLILQVKP